LFEYKTSATKPYDATNSIRFKLHVTCTKKNPGDTLPQILTVQDEEMHFNNANVYSGDLEWMPTGDQAERFAEEGIPDPKPLHDDILIAKLRPGQEVEMELICEKGIGKTHAKWSPVCTAFYRNLPDIRILEPIVGEEAEELKRICPMGVFDIEDIGGKASKSSKAAKQPQAIIKNKGEACTTCRECIRDDRFAGRIDLGKKKAEFEFHVESVGIYTPDDLVIEALSKLKEKAVFWYD